MSYDKQLIYIEQLVLLQNRRLIIEDVALLTIIAIKLLILRSFQRKGLCDSSLKAKSITFVRNIATIRLRSQIVILIINIEYESYKFCY